MNITTKARSNLSFGDADQYKSWNGRTGGNIPGSLLDSGLRLLCDDRSTWHRESGNARTCLYWHAGSFDASACHSPLACFTLVFLATYHALHALAAGRRVFSLIVGTIINSVESASYVLAPDIHVVWVMDRCESIFWSNTSADFTDTLAGPRAY